MRPTHAASPILALYHQNNAEFEMSNKSIQLAKRTSDYITFIAATSSSSHLPTSDREKAARWKAEDTQLQRQLGSRVSHASARAEPLRSVPRSPL